MRLHFPVMAIVAGALFIATTFSAHCDEFGQTKETRALEAATLFPTGPCEAQQERFGTAVEELVGAGIAKGFSYLFPPVGGAYTIYEGLKLAHGAATELFAWRCFYVECLKKPEFLQGTMTWREHVTMMETWRNNLGGLSLQEIRDHYSENACWNYQRNKFDQSRRCHFPNCFQPIESLPSIP